MKHVFITLALSFCFSVTFAQNFTLKSNDIEQMK